MKPLLIGSKWVSTGEASTVVNAYDGAEIGRVCLGNRDTIDFAIAAAERAFPAVRQKAPYERAELLQRVVEGIKRRSGEFEQLMVKEAGKPIRSAQTEVNRALDTFTAAAEEARRLQGGLVDMEAFASGKGHMGVVRRFPIGVISAICPFNFPLNLMAHKVAPCIASGNTMVVKPSPKTPLTALLLAEVLMEAGMPEGQINFVTCRNEDAAALVADERVKMVSFTGSPDVGWRLKELCGRKKIALELGGNAAVVLEPDADLREAVPLIANGAFSQAGQSCISVQRVLIHENIYDEFVGLLCGYVAEEVKTGDPMDPETVVGPLIDDSAVERVTGYLKTALDSGARLLAGGGITGRMMEATVVENVDPAQDLWSKEVFGPVVVLARYREFEEALASVNNSRFGLQAGVFTRDIGSALHAFEALEVGAVLINQVPTFRVETMPYGGVKQSGFGREGVRQAIEEMTEPRVLVIRN